MAQTALIKITIDPGKGVATINGVKVALQDLAAAQDQVTKSTEEHNKAIEGSLKWHQMQINKLKAEQAAISTSSEKYDTFTERIRVHNQAITEITQNREKELGAIKGSFQYYENQIKMLRRQQKEFADTNEAVLSYEKRIQSLRASQRELSTGTKLTGQGMQTMSTASGLAGAAATEFGRTIGDLPYGIQGVSNNVQQLTALFTDLVQAQGGVNKAFKVFTSTLMGPAGILVAVSLITTAFEMFQRSQRDSAKEANSLADAQGSAAVKLKILRDALENANTSEEKRNQLVTDANKEYKDLNVKLDENNQLTKESEVALNKQILAMERAAKARALQALIEEEYKKQAVGFAEDAVFSFNTILQFALNSLNFFQTAKPNSEAAIAAVAAAAKKAADAGEESQKRINKLLEQYLELKDPDKEKDRTKELEKIQKEREKIEADAIKRLQDQQDEAIANEELRELAKLDRAFQREIEAAKEVGAETTKIEEFYQKERERVRKEFQEKAVLARREANLDEFLDASSHAEKMARLEAQLAGKRLKDLLDTEKEQLASDIRLLESRLRVIKILAATSEEAKKTYDELLIVLEDLRIRQANLEEKTVTDQEKFLMALQYTAQTISAVNGFLDSEAQREVDRETNKTNAINEQLRERLRSEELAKDERDRINQEISRNEAALVEKENAINKKRFKQAKAFNIALAVINTYVAANKALNDETIPNTFVRIAAMVAVISAGLANVASISRQQFVGRVANTPTLRANGGGGESGPAFNVVGASSQNQLVDAIKEAQSQPVRAYVVSHDVTSGQELDRSIVQGASI